MCATVLFRQVSLHIKRNPPPSQSRCSSASLQRCVGEIEIEFKECVRAAFICIRNMSVCLHYMLRYVCVCVLTHCYGRNQQRLKMLVTSLDFIETRESEKGSKTSDMQKLIVILVLLFIQRLVSWTAVMVSIIIHHYFRNT